MKKPKGRPSRPRRTREHIIASQSQNFVEKFFIDKGHTVDRLADDYGTDLLVNTFDEDGYAESGDIRLQLKASDNFNYAKDGSYISLTVDMKHYGYWTQQVMPFFLVLYDAAKAKGFWLYVQAYFASDEFRKPKPHAKSVVVRVPTRNEFSADTVDYMRARKAAILQNEVDHEE